MIGVLNPTLQPVQGQFPVVGVWQNGLIVEQDGTLRAVGPSQTHHNLYPLKARLIQGEPLRVVAERVAMAGHTLRWLVSRIEPGRPYYLLGEVEMPDGRGPAITGRLDTIETYHPASYRDGMLRLHDARVPGTGAVARPRRRPGVHLELAKNPTILFKLLNKALVQYNYCNK